MAFQSSSLPSTSLPISSIFRPRVFKFRSSLSRGESTPVISSPTMASSKSPSNMSSSFISVSMPPSSHSSRETLREHKPLITAYSAAKPGPSGYVWCPVFKQYLPQCLVQPVYIITPKTHSPGAVGYLFGDAEGGEALLTSLSNGILMAKCVAKLFGQGDFAIIPAEDCENSMTHCFQGVTTVDVDSEAWELLHPEEQVSLQEINSIKEMIKTYNDETGEATQGSNRSRSDSGSSASSNISRYVANPNPGVKLKIVLMKPFLSKKRVEDMDLCYADLHNTVLEFKSSFRPDLRFLYFRYIGGILIWLNMEEAKLYKGAWNPTGKWLRESLVVAMARPGRLSNWAVYEEIVAGYGMFDDSGEHHIWQHKEEEEKLEKMAAQLEVGLLTHPDCCMKL